MSTAPVNPSRLSTGVQGLDHILRGGVPRDMVYVVHGGPGTGKTTLGFHFLLEGVRQKQRVLYASLLQTREELEAIVASHGWSLDGIDLLDLPESVRQTSTDEQTLFSPGEVELHQITEAILKAIQEHKPERLVFDSVTELAVLVDSPYQLRRQLLKLKQQLSNTGCTTLLTVNDTEAVDLPSIQTVVHGVVQLGMDRPQFGVPRRWLEATKVRGIAFLAGRHDFRLETGGIRVFPRLEITRSDRQATWEPVPSGDPQLDDLVGGGLEEATACLITGTTGAGKSTLAALYVQTAAERGERSIIFCFDERKQTYIRRAKGLGLNIARHIEQGLVDLRQVDVGTITPGEFAQQIREAVDEQGAKIVVIDSISGYLKAMPEQHQLIAQLHEILSYVGAAGVLTLLIVPTHGLGTAATPGMDVDTSYIADTVVLMRHFEAGGAVRRCIAVLKKRHGMHDTTIREVMIDRGGLRVGKPLTEFTGIFSGTPEYVGHHAALMDRPEQEGEHGRPGHDA